MKQVVKWIIIIPIIVGILIAGWITFKNEAMKLDEKNKLENVFGKLSSTNAEVTKFYTYGKSLNVEGNIKGISKDNFEGLKLVLTNGGDFEKIYDLSYSFEEKNLKFYSNQINNTIILDDLKPGDKYYAQIRLKANNSKDYKYYTLSNISNYKNIDYYTLTQNEKNNKVEIKFSKEDYKDKKYDVLTLTVTEAKLPKEIYDIVIDCGHGGTDPGEVSSPDNEKNVMLDYGKSLKTELEAKGYKVKLTRDDSNTDNYTDTNMYDSDGRITIACKTKAKFMISLHTGEDGNSGIQVYIPNNCDLNLADKLAKNIYNSSSLEFSGSNTYKKQDGIYQKNYTKKTAEETCTKMQNKGIEPYNITVNTSRLYTIREVGGIATNAYVDGRNTDFGANKYYNSNQGIECYQISIGSLKKEKDTIINEKEQIVSAIANAF